MEKMYETNETGSFCLEKILTSELGDKCALYARVTVPPGVAVPFHRHDGNGESYFFLAGEGEYDDNGTKRTVRAGDSTWTPSGSSHGLVNTGAENLVFMALIVNS